MSGFGNINWLDILKGFIVAVLTVVLAGVYTSVQSGKLPTLAELGTLGIAGLAAGIGYLIKNLFSNNVGTPLTKDVPTSTTVGELTKKI
jgi:hypothetical protein